MGIEAGGIALGAIAIGSFFESANARGQAASANMAALRQQSKLLELQYQQKQIQNLAATEKVLARQTAQMSTRGVTFDSPSFNAIQRETLNIGSRKESNLKAENQLAKEGLALEAQNVKLSLHASLFGDAANLGLGMLDLWERYPRMASNTPSKLPQIEDL